MFQRARHGRAMMSERIKPARREVNQEHRGSCLCGKVLFRTTGPLRGVIYCHCSQCRKQSGHYVAATQVADANISIDGSENLTWYHASPEARRGFCRACGSLLFWKDESLDRISIMAGSFERASGLRGESHIFVADKGDYYSIDDGLPQHVGGGDVVPGPAARCA
jgi:hypothetical protein